MTDRAFELTTAPSAEPLRPLMGANLLSSVGSLPLHLAPLWWLRQSRTVVSRRPRQGLIPTAVLLGQLGAALALPALAITRMSFGWARFLACMMPLSVLATLAANLHVSLAAWAAVGVCCGALLYQGTLAASRFPDKVFAFSLRLATVLILAGTTAGTLYLSGAFQHYADAILHLSLLVALILVVGIFLRGAETAPAPSGPVAATSALSRRTLLGLAAVFVFFMGQTGFLAFVIQHAIHRGLAMDGAFGALIAAKLLAGLWLLSRAFSQHARKQQSEFLWHGAALAGLNGFALVAGSAIVLLVALLAFEICINTLGARLQGNVAASQPNLAGRWLTGAILLGAATGPALNGLAIANGLAGCFVALSMISALAPFAWHRLTRQVASRG